MRLPMPALRRELVLTVAGADALNAAGIAFNLSAATLGNIVGGAVLVALGYWFIYA